MKKVTAEIIEKCKLFVAVKVRDDATNEDIEKAINVAYLDDDCEVLEQRRCKHHCFLRQMRGSSQQNVKYSNDF